jgi:hypothetical protein
MNNGKKGGVSSPPSLGGNHVIADVQASSLATKRREISC